MPFPVSIRTLRNNFITPDMGIPWGCDPFTVNDIKDAVKNNHIMDSIEYDNCNTMHNIMRIAYFIIHGWDDPILIDVGIPSLGFFNDDPFVDGNHRLYAAIIRKDKRILASISGELGYAARMFRCRIKDLCDE